MVNYNFPEDLYVKLVTGRRTERVKAEVYRRVESSDGELVHMKRAGLIWLDTNQLDLEHLAERLRDETSWDAHS